MRLNAVLLTLLAASVVANLFVRNEPSRPNFEYLPEMVQSVAWESHTSLRAPAPGTIARPPRLVRHADESARAATVFRTFCQPCHGPGGRGDGEVALRGYPPPPSLLGEKTRALSDSQIYEILVRGQKNMPSYASQLDEQDRRLTIRFVRSLQEVKP